MHRSCVLAANRTAPDIEELERMYENGESNADLSKKAVEIAERLFRETFSHKTTPADADRIADESTDFEDLMDKLRERRGQDALADYDDYMRRISDNFERILRNYAITEDARKTSVSHQYPAGQALTM